MIDTVTFNPSIDYLVGMDSLQPGRVNRAREACYFPGGKGINVSIMLNNLGVPCRTRGFLAGFTGVEIERALQEMGCQTDFIWLSKGISRINVKLRYDEETEINGCGPEIGDNDLEKLYDKLDMLQAGDFLVLAGSIPDSLPESLYENMMERLSFKEIEIVVDATGNLLRNVLKYKPFLVKPNHYELGELFGRERLSEEEIIFYGRKVQEMGAKNVLVSRAKDGAILIAEDGKAYQSQAPRGVVVNSVGAGDSMVAGFLAGYQQKQNLQEAFLWGLAAGSASAFLKELATKEEVLRLLSQMTV